MANVIVVSETPQRVIIRDEAATRTVKVVAQGPQGPSGNVNPLMFEMLDQANAASRSASISATAAGEHYAATSIRADEAEASAASALASQQSSTASAESAAQSAASASASANTAISSASSASLSASSANASATNAQASANTATTKASEAAAGAVAAQGAAAGVQANSEAAAASAAAAAASQSAAAASESSASGSATSASASASASAVSATNAAGSATSAGNSATAAAASATTASTKAGEASASAASALDSRDIASVAAQFAINAQSAAQTSANAALASKNAASASATDAASSATASAGSATAASGSATSASGSASTATTKASEAATSATNAAASATTASTKASEASTSATNAAASATAAATSATNTANALVGERSAVATLTNKTIISPVIDSGTANGVAYLDGSKVLSAGSALTFNGVDLTAPVYHAAQGAPGYIIDNQATGGARSQYVNSGGTLYLGLDNSEGGLGGPYTVNYWYTGNYDHVWALNNAEQMRLTSTGLGIGTSSPYSRLTVIPSADASSPFEANQITVGEASGNAAFRLQLGYFLAPGFVWSGSVQAIRSGVPTPLILNGGGGAVGIGTSSPSKPVTVISAGAYQLRLASYEGAYSDAGIFMGGDSDDPYYYGSVKWQQADQTFRISSQHGASAGGLVFETGSGPGSPIERIRIASNGNLGIGTSSPTANLDVAAVNPTVRINAISGGIPTLSLFSNGVYDWRLSGGTALSFVRDATTVATLDVSGNLGVGTSSPSAKIVTAQSNGGNTAYASVDSWADDFQTSRSGIGFNARIDRGSYSQAAVQLDAAKSGWLIQGRNAPGAEAVYDWFSVSRVSPTGVSTKMLNLDANGNLGLGVTPSAWFGTWKAIQVGASGALSSRSDVFGTLLSQNAFISPTGNFSYIGNSAASSYTLIGAEHRWSIAPSGTAGQPISFTQAMTLDASGNLLVGKTTSGYLLEGFEVAGNGVVTITCSSSACIDLIRDSDGNVINFYKPGGIVGSVSITNTATSYNTSSDYRLKDITGPVTTSGAYIDSLNPVEGTWKVDGSTFVGLIAHEVQEASRTRVATGVKDGEQMQAMDYSSSELIANMIAELKSLRARVAALESI